MFEIKYGKVGPSVREGYDVKANYFVICAMFKDARKEANITHEPTGRKNRNEEKLPINI